jgi:hypothetical protein
MKRIVLCDLPMDIQELVDERAKLERTDHREAVIAILKDAAIDYVMQQDITLLDSWASHDCPCGDSLRD